MVVQLVENFPDAVQAHLGLALAVVGDYFICRFTEFFQTSYYYDRFCCSEEVRDFD